MKTLLLLLKHRTTVSELMDWFTLASAAIKDGKITKKEWDVLQKELYQVVIKLQK